MNMVQIKKEMKVMSKELIIAIIFMNLALLFYSIGVWSEKIQKL